MKKSSLLVMAAAVVGTAAFQGSVNLQATTPGSPQNGHLNITGTARAGSVVGYSTAPTGQTFGGDFRVSSNGGRAILGNASSTTGPTYGGLFTNFSNAGRGVAGIAQNAAGTTYGGFFSSLSNQGRGVYGQATSLSGVTYGVYGKSSSPAGFGVYSEGHMHVDGNLSIGAPSIGSSLSVSTGSLKAIHAIATSTEGSTVAGHFSNASDSGVAIFGEATSATGSPYGVRGYSKNGTGVHGQTNSASGYGVYSEGNMHSTGIISGNGSGLTNLNATNIGTGILNDARLSTNVARLTQQQTFTGFKTFTGGFSTDSFQLLPSVTTAGHVLKTNSAGTGTWQQDGFTLPWATSATGSGTGLSLLQTGTGDLSNFTITNTASTAEAVQGTSNGTGDVFQAIMTGLGRAGYFSISNGASTTNALHAITNGTGAAVYGLASATAGSAYGGSFVSASTSGRAVYGRASASSGNTSAGYFEADSPDSQGVLARANSAIGATYGLYGVADLNNNDGAYGVFAAGDLGAAGSKSFRIDHPFDPENKYLLHYSSESPKPQNFYVGNVITDANGYAWVNLPDYFSAINTNFKYQLTVVDGPNSGADDFVQVKVRQKIKEGRFQIRTSAPNTEVSWRVDADRNDLYMRHRQPKDVIDKRRREIGTYQHPELYGLGAERGLNYDPRLANKPAKPKK